MPPARVNQVLGRFARRAEVVDAHVGQLGLVTGPADEHYRHATLGSQAQLTHTQTAAP